MVLAAEWCLFAAPFGTCWTQHAWGNILRVMKLTVFPKFTGPGFHIEGALRFTRSVRINHQLSFFGWYLLDFSFGWYLLWNLSSGWKVLGHLSFGW